MPNPMLKYFAYSRLPAHLWDINKPISMLAGDMDAALPDGPEKTAGLRKLLEAKDCFLRAATDAKQAGRKPDPVFSGKLPPQPAPVPGPPVYCPRPVGY